MSYVLQIMGVAGAQLHGDDPTGQFVIELNPDAHGGRGLLRASFDITEARRFSDVGEAIEYWRAVPQARPLRPDGKPNRPGTAYHMQVTPV